MCDLDYASDFQLYGGPANVSQGGMAMLTWYNKAFVSEPVIKVLLLTICSDESSAGDWGHLNLDTKPPGYDSQFAVGSPSHNYKFDPLDVVKGSTRNWISHGLNVDPFEKLAGKLAAESGSIDDLNGIYKAGPGDPGFFNLPVCVMNDLRYVPPNFNHYTTDVDSICICNTANNVDANGLSFADAAANTSQALHDVVLADPKFNGGGVCSPGDFYLGDGDDNYDWDL